MTSKSSFSTLENELLPELREKLNNSEGPIDVSNNFSYIVSTFLENVFYGKFNVKPEDILFTPKNEYPFSFSKNLAQEKEFQEALDNSDLMNIISRFSDKAYKRYIHLEKHLEKSKQKLRG
ncbi:MAG: hypothetical protein B6I28_01585 [Fusobacteriia bacterium 4572_132]|nr:MAG: hypothetical protein B6I28_01585 [Fusobacteriia bacterium 4572_132]